VVAASRSLVGREDRLVAGGRARRVAGRERRRSSLSWCRWGRGGLLGGDKGSGCRWGGRRRGRRIGLSF
jgi:hypothetical protein